ncbi:unnamed protein product [Acanthoscelides obtectus]|uniref:Uncharacterized protein n=1 Tax=Acanthoscelides obtectus TaxID=200917 RepID=A0A9P0KBL0_ACAOB|nr:unnamed protein product [Acanthoscelides obtectus]CAK1656020.1 hypothetical protein AOBTE_LOCUS19519 [Acanthoscelides obtectus]
MKSHKKNKLKMKQNYQCNMKHHQENERQVDPQLDDIGEYSRPGREKKIPEVKHYILDLEGTSDEGSRNNTSVLQICSQRLPGKYMKWIPKH